MRGEWVEREVGNRVHVVVGLLALAGGRPTPIAAGRQARDLFDGLPTVGSFTESRRRATRQAVATTAAVYFRCCVPPDGWVCIGAEVDLGNAVADMVWQHASGVVFIDELKTGRPGNNERCRSDQIRRLLSGGEGRWDAAFVGVRVVLTACPQASHMVGQRPGEFWAGVLGA